MRLATAREAPVMPEGKRFTLSKTGKGTGSVSRERGRLTLKKERVPYATDVL